MFLLIFVLAVVLSFQCCKAFQFEEEFALKPEKCYKVCHQGGCFYEECKNPQCPGGACTFLRCLQPSCTGGACTFDGCQDATCDGGNCNFINQIKTLTAGYCRGGSCHLDGVSHPDLSSFVSY